MEPVFRRSIRGQLLLSDTAEALAVKRQCRTRSYEPPKKGSLVRQEAMEAVRRAGGDVGSQRHLLGKFTVQFGIYRGQTFQWMVEHCPGYAAWLAIAGEQERPSECPRWINKMAMKKYLHCFEEGRCIIQMKKQENKPSAEPFGEEAELSDDHLVELVEQVESHMQASTQPSTSDRNVAVTSLSSTVKQSVFQEIEVTLPPVENLTTTTFSEPSATSASKHSEPSTSIASSQPTPVTSPQPTSASTASKHSEPSTSIASSQPTPVTSPQPSSASTASKHSGPSTSIASSQPTLVSGPQPSPVSSEPLLLEGWKSTLPKPDHQWIGKTFFRLNAKNHVEFCSERVTKLWNDPPLPSISTGIRNRTDRYFSHRLFLWMPINMWQVHLQCIHSDENNKACGGTLTRAGMHQKTRLVVDIDCYYIIAAEYLRCNQCGKKMVAWAHDILNQLDMDRQQLFPCILTAKYACDKKVIGLLRQRGMGNSSSMVCQQVEEAHGERYLKEVHHYLTNCKTFKAASATGLVSTLHVDAPPPVIPVPRHRWFMKVYQLDVLQRRDYIKAGITSLLGTILKIDSTKKITKKLAGRSAKTAMWATNVGNEYGQVIMSVLTTSEGHGLANMITGLCRRYHAASVPAPRLLYVDRDCCGSSCLAKYFSWPFLLVRLDIWHFMRRLSVGCTTDAHPLYAVFMSRLSKAIFRWDDQDVALLKKAKRAELILKHIPSPTDADVVRHIKSDELALHCRRVTRGTQETTTLISQLIASMEDDNGLDVLGVPLIDSQKMKEIWEKQSRHVSCLQDPDGVQLYTRIGTIKKGGIELPKYRCGRGSTSLESFHLHMNRFIPGTLASDVNFQVFLLDGIHRWNQSRQRDMELDRTGSSPLSYDGRLVHSVNQLARTVLDKDICPEFSLPGKYTGELIGLEYLLSQSTGVGLEYKEAERSLEEDTQEDAAEEEDEGFAELVEVTDITVPALQETSAPLMQPTRPARQLLPYPTAEDYRLMERDIVCMPFEPDTQKGTSQSRFPASEPPRLPASEPPVLSPTRQPSSAQQSSASSTCEQFEPDLQLSPATSQHILPPVETSPGQPSLEEPEHDESDIGPDNIPGYTQVMELAAFLVSLREQETGLSTQQADEVIKLWDALTMYDKTRTRFPQRFTSSHGAGMRSKKKKNVAPGVISIEKNILGPNATRASWPDCNRYVEATVQKLLEAYPSDRRSKKQNVYISRWSLVRDGYARIQHLVTNNLRVIDQTEIQLPSLNVKTIQQWHNKKGKKKDLQMLVQGLKLPEAPMTGRGAPQPRMLPEPLKPRQLEPFQFSFPPDTAGMAKLLARKKQPPPPPTAPQRFILPRPPSPIVSFPVVVTPSSSQPSSQLQIPPQLGMKRNAEVDLARNKPKKKMVRCGQCGDPRDPPTHQQYMGYRYCEKTDALPFQQWRANLQSLGVARKKKE